MCGFHTDRIRTTMRRLIVLLSLLILSPLAFSNTSSKPVLRVGVEDVDFYPLHSFKMPNKGMFHEVLQKFSQSSDVDLEYISLPVSRFSMWYEENQIEFRLPDHPDWNQNPNQSLFYSDPFLSFCVTTVVLTDNKHLPISQFERIGTISGFTIGSKWRKAVYGRDLDVVTDPSLRVLTRMLLNNMISAVDLDINAIHHQLDQLNIPRDTVAVSTASSPARHEFKISSINQPQVIEQFNHFVRDNQDWLISLYDKYKIHPASRDCQ